jgi:hypothetical protein
MGYARSRPVPSGFNSQAGEAAVPSSQRRRHAGATSHPSSNAPAPISQVNDRTRSCDVGRMPLRSDAACVSCESGPFAQGSLPHRSASDIHAASRLPRGIEPACSLHSCSACRWLRLSSHVQLHTNGTTLQTLLHKHKRLSCRSAATQTLCHLHQQPLTWRTCILGEYLAPPAGGLHQQAFDRRVAHVAARTCTHQHRAHAPNVQSAHSLQEAQHSLQAPRSP